MNKFKEGDIVTIVHPEYGPMTKWDPHGNMAQFIGGKYRLIKLCDYEFSFTNLDGSKAERPTVNDSSRRNIATNWMWSTDCFKKIKLKSKLYSYVK